MSNLSSQNIPEARAASFFGQLDIDQLTGELSTELLDILQVGDNFTKLYPAEVEPLQVTVSRSRAEDAVHWNKAYFGMIGRNLIRQGDQWHDREVVSTKSEPHGAVLFIHDAQTGLRLSPNDVTGIDSKRGNAAAILLDLLDRINTPVN